MQSKQELRKFAKEYIKEEESKTFLKELPHKYYDENMLHALLISEMKDFDQIIENLNAFLPFVDNLGCVRYYVSQSS